MVDEPVKKFAMGDLLPSPTTSNPLHKKPTRHHVKRRSSGRIHVSKLAPLARAQQPAAEKDEENEPRKPMKRSNSSKSLHRLSSNDPQRKVNLSGFTMTKPVPANDSPPITPTEPLAHGTPSPAPTFQVSHQSTAEPIAQTLNATANTLVAPARADLTNKSLHSRFVDPDSQDSLTYHSEELERLLVNLDQEYRTLCTFHDPMADSLQRCRGSGYRPRITQPAPPQCTFSSSILPTLTPIEFSPSRARARHQRLLQQHTPVAAPPELGWSPSALLDRMFYGASLYN